MSTDPTAASDRPRTIFHTDYDAHFHNFNGVVKVDLLELKSMLRRAQAEGRGLYVVPAGNHYRQMAYLIEDETALNLVLALISVHEETIPAFIR